MPSSVTYFDRTGEQQGRRAVAENHMAGNHGLFCLFSARHYWGRPSLSHTQVALTASWTLTLIHSSHFPLQAYLSPAHFSVYLLIAFLFQPRLATPSIQVLIVSCPRPVSTSGMMQGRILLVVPLATCIAHAAVAQDDIDLLYACEDLTVDTDTGVLSGECYVGERPALTSVDLNACLGWGSLVDPGRSHENTPAGSGSGLAPVRK